MDRCFVKQLEIYLIFGKNYDIWSKLRRYFIGNCNPNWCDLPIS